MASALAIDLPSGVNQKELIGHFKEISQDPENLLYVLHPFGNDKKAAVIAFKDVASLEYALCVDHIILGITTKLIPLPKQVFKQCSAAIDPIVVATLFKGSGDEVLTMLEDEFGLEVKRNGTRNSLIITGSMLQLTCAQSKLDVLYREHQWIQQRELIENMQQQFDHQSASAMQRTSDTLHTTAASEMEDVITDLHHDIRESKENDLEGSDTFWEDSRDRDTDNNHPLNASLQNDQQHLTASGLNFSLPAMHISDHPTMSKSSLRYSDEEPSFNHSESSEHDVSTSYVYAAEESLDLLNAGLRDSSANLQESGPLYSTQDSVMSDILQKQLYMSLPLGGSADLGDGRGDDLHSFRSVDATKQTRQLDHKLDDSKIIEHTRSRDDPGFLKPKLMFVMHASPSSTRSGRATVRSAASDPGKLPPTMPRPIVDGSQWDNYSYYSDTMSEEVTSSRLNPAVLHFTTPENLQVSVYTADICKEDVDVIGHSAREDLRLLGDVARDISDMAGQGLQEKCTKHIVENGNVPVTGTIAMESSGSLHSQYIIHAIGPMWCLYPDKHDCANALKETYTNTLDCATNDLNAKTIAITALSTGTFGVPIMISAEAAYKAINQYSVETKNSKHRLEEICIVNTDRHVSLMIVKTFKKLLTNSIQLQESQQSQGQFSVSEFKPQSARYGRSNSLNDVPDDDPGDDEPNVTYSLQNEPYHVADHLTRDSIADVPITSDSSVFCDAEDIPVEETMDKERRKTPSGSSESHHVTRDSGDEIVKHLNGKKANGKKHGRSSQENSPIITTPIKHSTKVKPPRKNKHVGDTRADGLMVEGVKVLSARESPMPSGQCTPTSGTTRTPRSGRSSGKATPVKSGASTPRSASDHGSGQHTPKSHHSGRQTPVLSGRQTPTLTGQHTPVVSSPHTPILSGQHTPRIRSGSHTPQSPLHISGHQTPRNKSIPSPSGIKSPPGSVAHRLSSPNYLSQLSTPGSGHRSPASSRGSIPRSTLDYERHTPTGRRTPQSPSGGRSVVNEIPDYLTGSGRNTPKPYNSQEPSLPGHSQNLMLESQDTNASNFFKQGTVYSSTDTYHQDQDHIDAEETAVKQVYSPQHRSSLDRSADAMLRETSPTERSTAQGERSPGHRSPAQRSPLLSPTTESQLRDTLEDSLK